MPSVDFHAYFQPPSFLELLRRREHYPMVRPTPQGEAVFTGPGAARPLRPEQTSITHRLRLMDEAGVHQQVLRLQNVGGIDAFEPDEARRVARAVNTELAALCSAHPGRFIAFAALPGRDPAAAAEELVHAVETLGHRGFGISCQFDGIGLDDPSYLPLLEAASALKVPMLLLPNHPPLLEPALRPYGWLAGAFGFQVDLTWAALRLLQAGIPDRFPDLPIIVANLGGVLTSITERLDEYWHRVHTGGDTLARLPSESLRHFHYETASAHPANIRLAAELFGSDRLLFGSDYPSFSLEKGMDNLRRSGLAGAEVEAILSGNAQRLFGTARGEP